MKMLIEIVQQQLKIVQPDSRDSSPYSSPPTASVLSTLLNVRKRYHQTKFLIFVVRVRVRVPGSEELLGSGF
jgi:hypothetical protein